MQYIIYTIDLVVKKKITISTFINSFDSKYGERNGTDPDPIFVEGRGYRFSAGSSPHPFNIRPERPDLQLWSPVMFW